MAAAGLTDHALIVSRGHRPSRYEGPVTLVVADGNEAARRLYLSAGFTVHHRYDYLSAPSPSDAGAGPQITSSSAAYVVLNVWLRTSVVPL